MHPVSRHMVTGNDAGHTMTMPCSTHARLHARPAPRTPGSMHARLHARPPPCTPCSMHAQLAQTHVGLAATLLAQLPPALMPCSPNLFRHRRPPSLVPSLPRPPKPLWSQGAGSGLHSQSPSRLSEYTRATASRPGGGSGGGLYGSRQASPRSPRVPLASSSDLGCVFVRSCVRACVC